MEYVVYLFFCAILVFNKVSYKKIMTPFSLIIGPYVLILFFNNHIFTKFHFLPISSETQWMILLGSIFFFIGNFTIAYVTRNIPETHMQNRLLERIDLKRFIPYAILVEILRIIQLVFLYLKHGITGLMENDYELLLTRGIIAHLLLSIFPFMMLLFYKWLCEKKQWKYLLIYVIFLVLAFIETEKAQVITIVLSTFLYCVIKNEKILIKGSILMISIVSFLFIANYFTKFTLQGSASDIEPIYYTNRLWNYIAGGLINSNYITENSTLVPTTAWDYVTNVVFALPNMFLNKVFNINLGANVYERLPYISSFPYVTDVTNGFAAQTGNVVSTMTMMYGNGNLFLFAICCCVWGIISELIFVYAHKLKTDFSIMLYCVYMSFSMLSFFGSYYTLASFHERLIIFILLGSLLFKKGLKLKFDFIVYSPRRKIM